MGEQDTILEVHFDTSRNEVVFTLLIKSTGEIRQKTKSKEWFFKRIYQSEQKTWVKNLRIKALRI